MKTSLFIFEGVYYNWLKHHYHKLLYKYSFVHGLPSTWGCRVGHDWKQPLATAAVLNFGIYANETKGKEGASTTVS